MEEKNLISLSSEKKAEMGAYGVLCYLTLVFLSWEVAGIFGVRALAFFVGIILAVGGVLALDAFKVEDTKKAIAVLGGRFAIHLALAVGVFLAAWATGMLDGYYLDIDYGHGNFDTEWVEGREWMTLVWLLVARLSWQLLLFFIYMFRRMKK